MKYLDLETCKYLVSLGCTSESGRYLWKTNDDTWAVNQGKTPLHSWQNPWFPAFSLEDLLRKDNAEKIWPDPYPHYSPLIWEKATEEVLRIFQSHPDTWPEEVKKIIMP